MARRGQRINGYPDSKLSGNIRIINYPFNYLLTWRLILFMYFFVYFSKFLRYFTKNLYINTSIFKIIAADLNVLPLRLYFRDFTLSAPPGPIMIFMILLDFHAPSVKSLTGNDAILVYGIPDDYPDNLLSYKRISGQ